MKPRPREIDIREISGEEARDLTGVGWTPDPLGGEEFYLARGYVWCLVLSTGYWYWWSESGYSGLPGWRTWASGPVTWDP